MSTIDPASPSDLDRVLDDVITTRRRERTVMSTSADRAARVVREQVVEGHLRSGTRLPEERLAAALGVSRNTLREALSQLVAERIVRIARLVGRENVIAGTDCGFAQGPFHRRVHPSIMWAKLEALAEGARLATKVLWG